MGEIIHKMCAGVKLPKMVKIRQVFDRPFVEDIAAETLCQLSQDKIAKTIQPGMSIAITAGSRGIRNIALITKTIVDFVKSRGAVPFIVPAMGSHGGACAEGQTEVLHDFGITESYCGCPIKSSMETVKVGETEEGHPVYVDKNAYEADGIIVSCRIKPHTSFRGQYESGIMKMMTIGLGKHKGAETCHAIGTEDMSKYVEMFANVIRKNAKILFGVASIENAYDETCKIIALTNDEIPVEEPALLEYAKKNMPRILVGDEGEVLIIDTIGKNLAGTGHDPNISGRFGTSPLRGGFENQRLVCLDLSDETHGNAVGMGLADVVVKRLVDKCDHEKGYANLITSMAPEAYKIPMTADCDADAIKLAVKTCIGVAEEDVRVVRVGNTLHVEEIWISENMLKAAKAHSQIEILSLPCEFAFDENGNLF